MILYGKYSDLQNKNNYPQRYFLRRRGVQALSALKYRTYRRWIDGGDIIPGRLKVQRVELLRD